MSESTKQPSNEAENGNKSKPMLAEVAVICPSYRDFLNFVREFEKYGEIYTWVYGVDKVRGKIFDRVEKLFNYYELKDIDDVLDYLETHLRSNLR